jgi:hypothetical protein
MPGAIDVQNSHILLSAYSNDQAKPTAQNDFEVSNATLAVISLLLVSVMLTGGFECCFIILEKKYYNIIYIYII